MGVHFDLEFLQKLVAVFQQASFWCKGFKEITGCYKSFHTDSSSNQNGVGFHPPPQIWNVWVRKPAMYFVHPYKASRLFTWAYEIHPHIPHLFKTPSHVLWQNWMHGNMQKPPINCNPSAHSSRLLLQSWVAILQVRLRVPSESLLISRLPRLTRLQEITALEVGLYVLQRPSPSPFRLHLQISRNFSRNRVDNPVSDIQI